MRHIKEFRDSVGRYNLEEITKVLRTEGAVEGDEVVVCYDGQNDNYKLRPKVGGSIYWFGEGEVRQVVSMAGLGERSAENAVSALFEHLKAKRIYERMQDKKEAGPPIVRLT